ncbi:hypothetical protein AB0G79_22305 [Streptomyces sp. NPDC020807]|uniref:hypothetical protein n=1 Tax=Streptomyces sp. NPDC020807 TaxID=3155119 RepID=UPI0033E215BE
MGNGAGDGVRGRALGALLLAGVLTCGVAACDTATPPDAGAGGSTSASTSMSTSASTSTSTSTDIVTTAATTSAAPPAPSAPSTPATEPRTTTPPPSEPQPSAVLVDVAVTGGFAGVRNRLVVHEDGAWTSHSAAKPPRTGHQTPAEAAALRAALEDPAFAELPERPAGTPVADGFTYTLTYRHRVVVADDRERPPALQRVFDALPDGGPPTAP